MIKENKVTIYGNFWDCLIYSNNLFLVGFDGTLMCYDWEKLITSHIKKETDELAYKCAFLKSDYLYGIANRDLFHDTDVKNLVINKLNSIEEITIESMSQLQKFRSCEKILDLIQLPTDLDVYKNTIYYSDSRGVFSRKIRRYDTNRLVSSKERKYWDCPIQSLKIGGRGRIALSASSEGLYEFITQYEKESYLSMFQEVENSIIRITKNHSSFSNWAFSSLLNSSYIAPATLFGFKYINQTLENTNFFEDDDYNTRILINAGEHDEKEMFGEKHFTNSVVVANNEKYYRLTGNQIEISEMFQRNLNTDDPAFNLIANQYHHFKSEIISAEVAEFGLLVELNEKIVIFLSTGRVAEIIPKENDEIVRWKVFSRSNCYTNHLHIIYKNRIEIISFNEDYFVDQKTKQYGFRHWQY